MSPPANADSLADALAKPSATGLLVAEILDGGQAAKHGLLVGDILTAYGGAALTDLKSLRDARQAAPESSAVVAIVRGEKILKIKVDPGSLGTKLVPVTKGVPAELLPADTGAGIDLSHAAFPVDAWYTIEIDKQKVGYEHALLTHDGEHITLKTEVAFTMKDSDGDVHRQHYAATIDMKSLVNPALLGSESRFEPGGFKNIGKLVPTGLDGKPAWVSKSDQQTTIAAPADLTADFGLEQLASFLPLVPGTCRHLTILNTGAGDLTDRAALKVQGTGEIEIAGKKIQATRIDCHTIGEISRTIWIDAQHRVVKSYWLLYSSFALQATLTDRAGALEGITAKELQPLH